MDPLYRSAPARTGRFRLSNGSAVLYYELRGSEASPEKVILLMGSLATLRHYDQLADIVASAESGNVFQVLTFDYRGIGSSTCKEKLTPQTSELLASDTLELIKHVWPEATGVHVYGASMGGMVAQKLALLMIPGHIRVKSLFLAVTAGSYGLARFVPVGPWFYKFVLPMALPSDPAAMVKSILPKCFEPKYLETLHPVANKTMGALWLKRWVDEYAEWYSFGDMDACAAQSTVAGQHHLTSNEAAVLVSSGIPIMVSIAEKDTIIAPAWQRQLAKDLQAQTHVSSGGHLGSMSEFETFCSVILKHLKQCQD